MNKYMIFIFLFFEFSFLFGQIKKVVNWTLEIKKINNSKFDLNIKADIDKDWFIFSQFSPVVASFPVVTNFSYSNVENLVFKPQVIELTTTYTTFDSTYNVWEIYFKEYANFKQTIQVLKKNGNGDFTIKYMPYNDVRHIAYPPEAITYKLYYSVEKGTLLAKKIE